MHFLVGLVAFALVLFGTASVQHAQTFTGLFYGPAALLVTLAPLCFAVSSYSFEELRDCLSAILRSLRHRSDRSRAALHDDLSRFAAEMRQKKVSAALGVAEHATHPLLRQLAPLVIKQYSGASLESTAATAAYCQACALRRSEDVLNTLARVSPAAGLIGTVLGLISLLKDLSKFEQLGPAMALALLCTLYGLLMANGLYQPLARTVHSYTTMFVEDSKLLTRALVLIGEGKSVSDIRRLFDLSAVEPGLPEAPSELERASHG